MAQQIGTESRGKPPITKHPLFPAIVALWFGALFGLGSLAVRPSLIETAVIASRLDTVVPAAAPPLGMTAHVLIAVVLAAIGGVLGALLGRRIGRDKPVERTRRRGADKADRATAAASVEAGGRDGSGQRRRSLAISEEPDEFAVFEAAPLPGGSRNVLDVTAVDIDLPALSEPAAAPFNDEPVAPMELTEVAPQGFTPATEPQPRFVAPVSDQPLHAPVAFEPGMAQTSRAFDPPAVAAEPVAAIEPAPFEPRPIDLGRFEPEPAPRFTAPQSPAVASRTFDAPSFEAPASPIPSSTPAPSGPLTLDAPARIDFSQPAFQAAQPVAEAPAAPVPEPVVTSVQPAPVPFPTVLGEHDVQRIAEAQLDTLSPVELIERLAMSIQQRRKAALAASTAMVPPATGFAPVTEPAPFASPAPEIAGSAPVASQVDTPSIPQAPAIPQAYEPDNAPEAVMPTFAADTFAPEVAQPEAIAPAPVLPAALRPLSLDDVEVDEIDLAEIPPRHIAMPQSQPLFGAQTEPSPRLFDAPAPTVGDHGGFTVVATAADPVAGLEPESAIEEATAEDIPEEAYSSLLDLGRPVEARAGFVRIDEPEAATTVPEPVVIFPGHAAQQPAFVPAVAPAFASPAVSTAPAVGEGTARRFDGPSVAVGGVQTFTGSPPPLQDAAETEQALRSALANLQRMSGAA